MTNLTVLLHKILFAQPGVDLGPVEDVSSPGGVVQSGESLLYVDGGRRDGGDDGGLGRAPETVLQ